MSRKSIYDIPVRTIDGRETTLAEFKGKALLIVNTASECGYTPQYEGLEALQTKLGDKGFTVLGFPCNQFGGQEPGSDQEIAQFCDRKFKVSFPMFSKIDVNGPATHPLYAHLKSAKGGIFGMDAIKWNFTKFLVDRNGNVVERFAPQTKPEAIEKEILPLLK